MERSGRFWKLSDPAEFSVSMSSSHWTKLLWTRSTREDPRRGLEWKEQVSHPSLRFTMAALEKTIRPLKQWALCNMASVSSWSFFFSYFPPNTFRIPCEITADVRAERCFCVLHRGRRREWRQRCLKSFNHSRIITDSLYPVWIESTFGASLQTFAHNWEYRLMEYG